MSEKDPLVDHVSLAARAVSWAAAKFAPPGEVDDLAQELWLYWVERGERLVADFGGRASLQTYLCGVLKRQALQKLRAPIRWSTRTAALDGVRKATARASALEETIENESRRLQSQAVRHALSLLGPDERDFFLRCLSGTEPMNEIARAFGITRAAAYSRKARLMARVGETARERVVELTECARPRQPIRSDPIAWIAQTTSKPNTRPMSNQRHAPPRPCQERERLRPAATFTGTTAHLPASIMVGWKSSATIPVLSPR